MSMPGLAWWLDVNLWTAVLSYVCVVLVLTCPAVLCFVFKCTGGPLQLLF